MRFYKMGNYSYNKKRILRIQRQSQELIIPLAYYSKPKLKMTRTFGLHPVSVQHMYSRTLLYSFVRWIKSLLPLLECSPNAQSEIEMSDACGI